MCWPSSTNLGQAGEGAFVGACVDVGVGAGDGCQERGHGSARRLALALAADYAPKQRDHDVPRGRDVPVVRLTLVA